ncbi:MAG: hypothetical protein C0485_00280 [Pirellula sp.]|nr:hypothetical protein [Pirellula sp.]
MTKLFRKDDAMKSTMTRTLVLFVLSLTGLSGFCSAAENELVGYWKLRGDCRDYSGKGNHGVNHGVDLTNGTFDGEQSYLEAPSSESLKLGADDFTFCAHINTAEHLDDIVGDVIDMYDPDQRRGVTLAIKPTSGGYQSQGTDRHVHFGIDQNHITDWQDCGRPNPTSSYVSNSLTVFDGKLYAATTDAADEAGWCHVYRYEGGSDWTDCGRVGAGKTTGVLPLIVHNGSLYAATSTYDWTRVKEGDYEPGRVYRYLGDQEWEDVGQPSDNRTLNSLASYKGKLYAGGGPSTWGVFVLDDDGQWKPSKIFEKQGPKRCFPHAMSLHNGKLYVGYPGVYEFDGETWTFIGDPVNFSERHSQLQTHEMELYQGKLLAGVFPEAIVAAYAGGDAWEPMGRVGVDGTEVLSLVVYNGQLYGSSLPRAEVCRYEGNSKWTSLKRFHSPEGWEPGIPPNVTRDQVNEMARVTSMAIHNGRLFASTGSCTSAAQDSPLDVRGKVFSLEAGKSASYDKDLGPGWKHLAAVRRGERLQIYIDGKLAAESTAFEPGDYDISTDRPLRIGFGQTEYFAGKMADVRLYAKALSDAEIEELASTKP